MRVDWAGAPSKLGRSHRVAGASCLLRTGPLWVSGYCCPGRVRVVCDSGTCVMHGLLWMNFLKNRRFRRVILPVPCTLTRYWSCSPVWMTVPSLSHFLGFLAAGSWFCKNTVSPSLKGGSSLLCCSSLSQVLTILERTASSLADHACRHWECICGLSKTMADLSSCGIASLSRWPNKTSAGLR